MTEESTLGLRFIKITTSGILSENTSQVYAIKNPLVFICGVSSLYDWYTESFQNNALWGDNVEKSAYDPCPADWRVPTDASLTFGDITVETTTVSGTGREVANGRTYQSMAWFPMAGRRNNDSGTLRYVGGSSCSWSASISDTYSKSLYYDTSNVGSDYLYSRAYGQMIRCVQE